ncbi:MAG TPA: rhodanese-like domain-containing protein [Bacteroidia bacterium]|jgi:thioredoxin 1|nr:rhodanese-like domain-containing protein [Bacteroidia bacterium]
MKTFVYIAAFCLFSVVSSCQSNPKKAGDKTPVNTALPVDDFEKKLTSPGVQLVDVRTPEEFNQGHLKGAINYDYRSPQFTDQISKLDKSKPVMVYCLSGGRSGAAAGKLGELGFQEVYNMQGGMMKWNAAQKPVEGASAPLGKGMCIDDFNMLLHTDKYVLVDYNATWCQPCKRMAPMLDSLVQAKADKLKLVKIDADENKDLLKLKGVEAIPVFELYKDGKLIWKHEGEMSGTALVRESKL